MEFSLSHNKVLHSLQYQIPHQSLQCHQEEVCQKKLQFSVENFALVRTPQAFDINL